MASNSKPRTPYATLIAIVVVGAYYLFNLGTAPNTEETPSASGPIVFDERSDGSMIEAAGVVTKVLPDDDDGSRHQRFIVRLSGGQTLLIAHNIDLAPRIAELKRGDAIKFRGQFETNNRGGVVHWTHHDPRGQHPAGWLEHGAQRYQ